MNFAVDLLLMAGVAIAFALAFFWDGRVWVGDVTERDLLDWDTAGRISTRLTNRIIDPTWEWGLRHRWHLALVLAAAPIVIGMIAGAFTGGFSPFAMIFTIAGALPLMYYRPRQQQAREADAILPGLLIDVLALIADGGNLTQALQTAAGDGEGPVYLRLRQALARSATDADLGTALRQLASEFERPNFTEFANVVASHNGDPASLRSALTSLEERLSLSYEEAVTEALHGRSMTLLAVTGVGLLPALLIIVLLPAIMELMRGTL